MSLMLYMRNALCLLNIKRKKSLGAFIIQIHDFNNLYKNSMGWISFVWYDKENKCKLAFPWLLDI